MVWFKFFVRLSSLLLILLATARGRFKENDLVVFLVFLMFFFFVMMNMTFRC